MFSDTKRCVCVCVCCKHLPAATVAFVGRPSIQMCAGALKGSISTPPQLDIEHTTRPQSFFIHWIYLHFLFTDIFLFFLFKNYSCHPHSLVFFIRFLSQSSEAKSTAGKVLFGFHSSRGRGAGRVTFRNLPEKCSEECLHASVHLFAAD